MIDKGITADIFYKPLIAPPFIVSFITIKCCKTIVVLIKGKNFRKVCLIGVQLIIMNKSLLDKRWLYKIIQIMLDVTVN